VPLICKGSLPKQVQEEIGGNGKSRFTKEGKWPKTDMVLVLLGPPAQRHGPEN